MHVLFTAVPGQGHVNPMVPLARTLEQRGHSVTFSTGAALQPRVQELGFTCIAAGPTIEEMQADALADPGVRASLATEPWRVAAAIFAGRAAAVLDDLSALDRAPDLVVHDAYELAGPLLAAGIGVPWATHGLGPRWPAFLEALLGGMLEPEWLARGCAPVPRGGLGHHAYIEICPPSVRADDATSDGHVIAARPVTLDERPVPVEHLTSGGRPRVYATLGTFSNSDAAPFRAVLDACASLDADVVMTIGDRIDVVDLGPVPPNVSIKRYVPQAQVLAACDLVICHGGSGTTLGALAAGVPAIIVPQGADQFRNAPFWARSGAAIVVEHLDAGTVDAALAAARPGGALHGAARRVAAEIAAMPPPDVTAAALEAIARA